jgi:hypothetical protein
VYSCLQYTQNTGVGCFLKFTKILWGHVLYKSDGGCFYIKGGWVRVYPIVPRKSWGSNIDCPDHCVYVCCAMYCVIYGRAGAVAMRFWRLRTARFPTTLVFAFDFAFDFIQC